MARLARVVVPGLPQPVRQGGNRRLQTRVDDRADRAYNALAARQRAHQGVVQARTG